MGGRNGLNTPYPSSHGAFGENFKQTNLAGSLHMCSTAQFTAESGIKSDHAHNLAVFFPKKHHRARIAGFFDGHIAVFIKRDIGADFFVDHVLNLPQFTVAHFLEVVEVKTQALVVHVLPLLGCVLAKDAVQCGVHKVNRRVVAGDGLTQLCIHYRFDGQLQIGWKLVHHMDDQVIFLLGIQYVDAVGTHDEVTLIARLTTTFGVERGSLQHQLVLILVFDVDGTVFQHHGVFDHQGVVTFKLYFAIVHTYPVAYYLGGIGTGAFFLFLQGSFKAYHVDRDIGFLGQKLGQIDGEAEGVVEVKSIFPFDLARRLVQIGEAL